MKWTQEFGLIYWQWDKSNTVVSMFGTSTFRDKIRWPLGQRVGYRHSRTITHNTLSSVTLCLPLSEDDCLHAYGMTFLQWFNVYDDSTRCMHFSDKFSCSSYFLRLCHITTTTATTTTATSATTTATTTTATTTGVATALGRKYSFYIENGFRCSWQFYVLITNIRTVLYLSLLTHSKIPRAGKTSSPPLIHIFPVPEFRSLLPEWGQSAFDWSAGMFRAKFCLGCVLCNLGWLWGGRRLRPAGPREVLNIACVIVGVRFLVREGLHMTRLLGVFVVYCGCYQRRIAWLCCLHVIDVLLYCIGCLIFDICRLV
jgi:hypothetical protein